MNTYILKITIQNLKNYVQILCEIYKKKQKIKKKTILQYKKKGKKSMPIIVNVKE